MEGARAALAADAAARPAAGGGMSGGRYVCGRTMWCVSAKLSTWRSQAGTAGQANPEGCETYEVAVPDRHAAAVSVRTDRISTGPNCSESPSTG